MVDDKNNKLYILIIDRCKMINKVNKKIEK